MKIRLRETFSALMEQARLTFDPRTINLAVANGVAKVVRSYLRLLDSTRPNKLGGDRTHFYANYAKGTRAFADENKGAVLISDPVGGINEAGKNTSPLAAHYFGAHITPFNASFLAIPARAEFYGHRPREFNNLAFAVLPKGGPVLIERDASELHYTKSGKAKSRGTIGGIVAYWLKKSVDLQADQSVLPSEEAVLVEAKAAVLRLILPFSKGMSRGVYYGEGETA